MWKVNTQLLQFDGLFVPSNVDKSKVSPQLIGKVVLAMVGAISPALHPVVTVKTLGELVHPSAEILDTLTIPPLLPMVADTLVLFNAVVAVQLTGKVHK